MTVGVAYVRWGKKNCPNGSEIVYTGDKRFTFYKHYTTVNLLSIA